MIKYPMTPHGADALKEELASLKVIERWAVIDNIAEARAHGDLSENAEYDSAKDRQAFVEGRIAELEAKLNMAQIIDPKTVATEADGRVVFSATVDLEDMILKKKVTYQIVGEDEANIKKGKLSVTSPVARALIGRYAGDIAVAKAPAGNQDYKILDVRYV